MSPHSDGPAGIAGLFLAGIVLSLSLPAAISPSVSTMIVTPRIVSFWVGQ